MAFPAIDGGVRLVWRSQGFQFTLSFRPKTLIVETREKYLHSPTICQHMSEQDASKETLDFLRKIA